METDKITSSYRRSMGSVQKVVDVVLQKEDENSIAKVLSSTANAYLDEVEILNGEARYSGGVVFNCLYIDNQGKNHVLTDTVNMSDKFDNPVLNPLMKAICKVEIIEISTDILDDDRVKLTARVEITCDCIVTEEVDQVRADASNLQVLREPIREYSVVSSGEKTFNISEQIDTKFNINRVLLTSANTVLKNVAGGTGYFTVEGEVFVNMLVEVTSGEDVELKNIMQTIGFKEEIEDDYVQKEDLIYAFAYAKPQDVGVEIASQENATNNSLNITVGVTTNYVVLRMTEATVNADVFSTTNKTNLITDSFTITKSAKQDVFKTTVEGQTTIAEDEPRIAKVCAVNGEHLTIANNGIVDGFLTIEGIAYASVVYLTDDDEQAYNSIDLEVPFSVKFDVGDMAADQLFVAGHIVDLDAKARKGKEINTSFEIVFTVDSSQTENQFLVKDVELTEQLPKRNYSLALYLAPKGSTLWDVSKHLLTSQEVLTSQNPDVVFPLENATNIVYFKQLV